MPKKNNRTPKACLHQFNPPVPPATTSRPKYVKRTQFATTARPILRNEPNPSPANSQKLLFTKRTQSPPGNSAKRTQFQYTKCPDHPKKTKRTQFQLATLPKVSPDLSGNPISTYQVSRHTQKMRNEPNLLHPYSPTDPKKRNEPNFSCSRPVERQKNETNPIYAYPSPAHDPKIRNEPNLSAPELNTEDQRLNTK